MKYIKKNIYLLLLPLLAIVSCDDGFEGVNSNPNEPEEVDAGVLMTGATRASMSSMVNHSYLYANNIAQLTAKTLRSEVDRYDFQSFPTLWLQQYDALRDFKDAELISEGNENYATQAASIIMQTNVFYTLTMAYGDIPYTEATQGIIGDNFNPAYDSMANIFTGEDNLLQRLQGANSLLDQAINNGQTVDGDVIFDGSPQNWQKLSNVLQLRILLHLSNKQDVSTQMSNLLSNGSLFDSNADNALFNYLGSFPNDYPTFRLKQGDFTAVVLSNQPLAAFEKYDDPRLGRYARPNNTIELETFDSQNATYSGAENGDERGSCDKGGSLLGSRYYNYPDHPVGDTEANGIITTYSEQELIIAEAIASPKITLNGFGSAADHYKEGIKASMDYYDVDYGSFGYTSFDDFYSNSGIAHGGSPSLVNIQEQKWLATFFHGMEPYFDTRRMVYQENNGTKPFLANSVDFLVAPCENQNDGEMPTKFLYPGNEISLNSDNYQNTVEKIGGNTQNGVIWIME